MDTSLNSKLYIYYKFIYFYTHIFIIFLFYAYLEVYPAVYHLVIGFISELPSHTFDYIVVGGGTAGSLLAARLSERKDASILLLEAGAPLPAFLDIPVLGSLVQRSAYDWGHQTVPQEHACFALKQKRSRWPAGRALGGSSHLNYLLYVPGNIEDFSDWKPDVNRSENNTQSSANDSRNHWSKEDIRGYFEKSQSVTPIKEVPYSTPLSSAVLSAAKALGFATGSLNLGTTSGFGKSQVYLNPSSSRWTPADYLQLVKHDRKNLVVKTGASVTRILIKDKIAYGVEVNINGKLQNVVAKKEVILSAGTIGSALLLMRSGIGPKNVLDSAKVHCLLDLPVGRNLQDHVTTGLDLVLTRRHLFGFRDLTSPTSFYSYFLHGKGAYTTTLCEAVGMFQSNTSSLPELEYLVMMAGASSDGGLLSKEHLGLRDDVWLNYFVPLLDHQPAASIMPVLLHPKSSGDVRLNPEDPAGPPLINPNYLSHPDDVNTLIDGLQFIHKLVKTPEMQSKGFFFNEIPFPGCNELVFGERSYWGCYIRQLTLTSYHPIGTCKMGHKEDSAVVDHSLRVHGLTGLRVVDASVMPTLPSGNPQAAILMIAEKAADLIKLSNDAVKP